MAWPRRRRRPIYPDDVYYDPFFATPERYLSDEDLESLLEARKKREGERTEALVNHRNFKKLMEEKGKKRKGSLSFIEAFALVLFIGPILGILQIIILASAYTYILEILKILPK